ncbi:MAG: RluA family pseudouridine synthase [Parachlamydiales bacterium]|jgi:23S rRNA pseudouridine1911/1915/1917 synthase
MKSSDKEAKVLFLDNHLLVAVKPSGWLTQPNESAGPSLENYLKEQLKKQFSKPGAVFLHALHRLDKPVSGLVLFAKTSKALLRLNRQIAAQKMEKTYRALAEGRFREKEAFIEHFLVHEDHRARVVEKDHPEAKKALLHYRVLEERPDKTLLEIRLLTGRYHQIRSQLSHLGHPIAGDGKYGSKTNGPAIALHAFELSFFHPVTGASLVFSSPPPF